MMAEKDVWDELWTRKVTPEEREDWLYEVKAAGDAHKKRCQYHKEQSKERGEMVSLLRKSRDGFMESLAREEGKIVAVKTWLKNAKAQGRISMSDGMKMDEILEIEPI